MKNEVNICDKSMEEIWPNKTKEEIKEILDHICWCPTKTITLEEAKKRWPKNETN